MPKISVIIPVYNVEKYLQECLDSVLKQTFTDYEVICVNDGSTDKSSAILKKYQIQHKNFQVITQKNKGLSGARNTGLKAAKGKYIFFLDSDDIIPPYALDLMYQTAKETQAPIVVSAQITKQTPNDYTKEYTIQKPALKQLLKNRHIFSSAWNKLYRREILKNHFFIEGIYFEDWPFITTLFEKIDFFALVKAPCYVYRNDNTSITRSAFTTKKADSYLTGIHFVYDYFQQKNTLHLAQNRIAIAVKMLINKTYHSKDKKLKKYVVHSVQQLIKDNIIPLSKMNLKTLIRLFLLKIRN